jgi:acyl dehydratase
MPLDYEKLKNWKVEPVTHQYTSRDAILYALGIGLGFDPVDENELRFLHEKNLQALPTLATVLGYPWGWIYKVNAGATRLRHVLAEQGITIHKLPPPQGEVISHLGVTHIVDKGKDRGALIFTERKVYEKQSGDLLCTLSNTMFCRGDGGFDGPAGPLRAPQAIPQRAPDAVCALPSLPQAALIYQLCGDRNPLHVDPAVAQAAGFKRPILHGLCTFGMAGHALLKTYCDYDSSKLLAMEGRFSAPVFPGETVTTEMWREAETVVFRASVAGRDAVVINNGHAVISGQ